MASNLSTAAVIASSVIFSLGKNIFSYLRIGFDSSFLMTISYLTLNGLAIEKHLVQKGVQKEIMSSFSKELSKPLYAVSSINLTDVI